MAGIILVLNLVLSSFALGPQERVAVSYTFFSAQVSADNVATITATGEAIQGTFKKQVDYPPGAKDTTSVSLFSTQRPSFADDDLFNALQKNGTTINADPPDAPAPLWQQLLVGVGPTLLIFGLLYYAFRRVAAGAGGLTGAGGFGRSRAQRYEPDSGPRTTFADVAGIDEVEDRTGRDRRLPAKPRPYRALGRHDP